MLLGLWMLWTHRARSYFKAISPLLERNNANGYTSDWPSVMQNAAKRVKAHFDEKTHNPCSVHGIDTASPPGDETPMYKSALAPITEVIRHFQNFRPTKRPSQPQSRGGK